jgi:putative hemolysin
VAGQLLINIGIVLVLILIEAIFVAAEFALVSLRDGQVRALADGGRRGAAVARLVSDPNRYLGIVQILITLTSLLSSAFGAVTLSEDAKRALVRQGMSPDAAGPIGFLGITLLIAFITLVIGEQVPKRLALQRTEGTAKLVSPTLDRLATLLRPVLWLISRCTDALVRAFGGNPQLGHEPISEDELRGLVAAHESLTSDERRLIDEVFAAGERSIDEVMVPRTDVTFLEAGSTVSRAARAAAESTHSRYPVVGRGHDDVIGFVHIRDLLLTDPRAERDRTVRDVTRPVKAMPGSKRVLAALSEMRREGHHLAIVVDEYGGTDGIVTLEDLIEEVIGEIRDEYDEAVAPAERLPGGAVEVDGKLNLDEVAEISGLALPDGPYSTLGGYLMAELGRLARADDVVECVGYRLEIVEVEGRRAARVRITPPPEPVTPPNSVPPQMRESGTS